MSDQSWPPTQPELSDGVLTLRPWRETDAPVVHDACQDESVQRWTRVSVPYLREDAIGFVTRLAPHQWASGAGAAFAIVDDSTGAVVGSMGLVRVDRSNHWAEAGYWMRSEERGRGLASRALRVLSTWALDDLHLSRVELRIEVENAASRTVATRAGFTLEGVMRSALWHRGAQRDVALYSRVD